MRSASARGTILAAVVALAPTAAAEPPRWIGGTYRSAAGEAVTLYVSSPHSPEQAAPQRWAEFFAGLPHGSELGSLVVRVGTPGEVRALCGEGALGCYSARELVMPGEAHAGETPEQVARHEYGHHVAASRANPPWRAESWGPKRWATAAHVCERTQRGTAFPGDDGTHYRLDPVATPLDGELTAELRVPPGRLDGLELLTANGRLLTRGLWFGTQTRRLSFVVCGQRRLVLRVRSAGPAGSFDLTLSRP